MDQILKLRYEIERLEGWRESNEAIPSIPMEQGWKMKPLAPFGGAMARFRIDYGSATVSVYLDTKGRLGGTDGKPYWEVYPWNGDVGRWELEDVKGLSVGIKESIAEQCSDVELILEGLKDGSD